jgi:hypothetical protein
LVSTGLLVVGGDAVFVNTPTLGPGSDRMSMDGFWVRDSNAPLVIPMRPCDMRDIQILSRASNAANPNRSELRLPHFIYRPGDINLNGVTEPTDYAMFTAMPYDYNLDGYLNSADYIAVLNAITTVSFCE